MRLKRYIVLFCLVVFAETVPAQIITTISGDPGFAGYSIDGYLAIYSGSAGPTGILKMPGGNLYIAEERTNKIRIINTAGFMGTLAGNGNSGAAGDGGPAINAEFALPRSLTKDNAGNVYLIDQYGNTIRRISPAGIITRIAGLTNGNGYTSYSGDGGPVGQALFGHMADICCDNAGNLYVADDQVDVIRKINLSTGIITTIAGNGYYGFKGDGGPATAAQLYSPAAIAADNAGNIYIADWGNKRIRKINAAGIITTIAGTGTTGTTGDGGAATSATVNNVFDMAVDNAGNLYIAGDNMIRKITVATGVITRFAGTGVAGSTGDEGPPTAAQVSPTSISFDTNGDLYIADNFNFVIRKIYCPTPVIDRQPVADTTVCNGSDVPLFINASFVTGYQWQVNTGSGWNNITDNGTYSGAAASLLHITPAAAGMNNYQYRCITTNSCGSSTSSVNTLHVTPSALPTISITRSAGDICSNNVILFTAAVTNAGPAPVYQWEKNGIAVGSNATTYSDGTLRNGDIITCALTSNAACAVPATAASNTITITVPAPLTPSITVQVFRNNICPGQSIGFKAIAVNKGLTPLYQWKVNGVNVGSNGPDDFYNSTTLVNGDQVTCTVTSSSPCAIPVTATSTPVTAIVGTTVTPSIVIAAPTTSICTGNALTFTAAVTGGGDAPVYQWKRNGTNVGTNSNTYSSTALTNGDIITCVLTSNASCATTPVANSNPVTVSVSSGAAAISIAASPGAAICTGIPVVFTATAVNAGSTPIYQWKKNGVNVGANDRFYSDNTLTTGNIITCVLTSSAPCAVPATATSNAITMTVNPLLTPTISIAASVPDLCAPGGPVTFTATVTNAGPAPVYVWKRNGAVIGTNSNTFVYPGTLINGISITCELQTNSCGPSNVTVSNAITVNCACGTSTGTINTYTGTSGTFGNSPTGTPRLSALIFGPWGIDVGKTDGLVYFTDQHNQRICKIDAAGNLVHIAGNVTGTQGDGPGMSITLSGPGDLVCDKHGNAYFTDRAWTQLRKIDPAGNVTTLIQGSGPTHSGDGGPVSLAEFTSVADITIDNNDNIYILNDIIPNDITVRRIDGATGIVTTIAGIGAGTANTGDGGPATAAQLYYPRGIVCDNAGNVYIGSATCIRKIDIATGIISTFAGNPSIPGDSGDGGPASAALLNFVRDLAIDNAGNIYVYDGGSYVIRKIGTDGIITHFAGISNNYGHTGDGGPAAVAAVNPVSIAVASSGLYITENSNDIRKIDCPTVTISRQPVDTIFCGSGTVTFSMSACNADSYQWQVNTGTTWTNIGNNAIYTGANTNVLQIAADISMNNYQYRCTASTGCGSDITAAAVLHASATTITSSLAIAASASIICAGTNVTFTAIPVNPGMQPFYQWKKNGVNTGLHTNTYTDNTLSNGDIISCVMTSSAACILPVTATSNTITMTVTTPATPSVSVTASATAICQGSPVTFTATGTNTGATPVYQWKKNGANTGTNSTTYTDNNLANGDIVYCEMTAGISCALTGIARSNFISITVNDPATPTITIAASATTVCAGTMINFTSTIANGGTTPVYQWKKNNVNVGANNPAYSDNTLNDGDIISCTITSNSGCITTPAAVSNTIPLHITSPATPSITIVTTSINTCPGSPVTFTSTIVNGGTVPAYQWKKNGANTGTNNPVYTDNTLANGDIITCVLTSNQTCISTAVATSNPVTVTLNTPVTPTIAIAASDNRICTGTSIRFTAAVTNEGTAPIYQWKKNAVNVGTNTSSYTDNSLNNGDIISCVLTSSAGCVAANNIGSNTVVMNVIPTLASSLTITASRNSVCADSVISFAAASVNAGATPSYVWKINGVAAGANSPFYFSNQLQNNDIITCEMTPGYSCAAPAPAVSNQISVSIIPAPVVTLDQTATLCTGSTRTLSAGTFSSYLWSDGSAAATLPVNNIGTWWVIVTDNNGCKGSDTTTITNLLPLPAGFLPIDTSFCAYDNLILQPYSSYQHYSWSNGSTSPSISISQPGNYSLEVTDNNNCVGNSTVAVSLKDCLKGLYVPTAFTPNHDGRNDLFKATLAGNIKQFQLQIFNRWGNIVFQSSNPLTGWDGTFHGTEQDTGTFVWLCKYQLEGEPVKTATGKITLIR